MPPFYHFSFGIKAKKPKTESAAVAPQITLPTIYELASLAIKLFRDTPEAQKDFPKELQSAVQKAETLWILSRDKVSQMRFNDSAMKHISEKEKRLLENVKRPKTFPTSMEEIIRCLIPKRSVADRKTICKKFIDLITPSDWVKGFDLEFKQEITELEWPKLAIMFRTWYPAHQRDVAISKASNAATIRHLKNTEKNHLTENPVQVSPKQP